MNLLFLLLIWPPSSENIFHHLSPVICDSVTHQNTYQMTLYVWASEQNLESCCDVRSEAGTLQTLNTVPHNKSPPSWPEPWWGPALLMDYLYIFNSAPPHVGTRCNHVNITQQHITWPPMAARDQNKVKMIPEILDLSFWPCVLQVKDQIQQCIIDSLKKSHGPLCNLPFNRFSVTFILMPLIVTSLF